MLVSITYRQRRIIQDALRRLRKAHRRGEIPNGSIVGIRPGACDDDFARILRALNGAVDDPPMFEDPV